ncbi:MAG: NAD-dependent epimerase/dehydratase family protein [Methanobacteriota archaeon]|nr:MAG: NAD-dependent epimerase/dehydratase family protein [Euryarchaeota archaeon]
MTRVLITGGNGFIGSQLAERLEESGDTVTLFDLGFDSNSQGLTCKKIRGDVRDYPAVKSAVDGQDAVFHLAAISRVAWGEQDPHTCWQTNLAGTVNVLEACEKAQSRPALFYASSREIYGEPENLPVNETARPNPISVYGMTKLSAERACRTYSAAFGRENPVKQVVFRFSNVYGTLRDLPQRVIPTFMRKALGGEDITLYGGDQTLDFTFIDDTVHGIVQAYHAALDHHPEVYGEAFQFVTGRGVSVSELARMIVKLTDSPSRVRRSPSNGFEVRRFVGDPSKARRMLGYEPKVRLEDGLKILRELMTATPVGEARLAA